MSRSGHGASTEPHSGCVEEALGRSPGWLVGTPYASGTLDEPGPERLVVNVNGLDCLTFVETVLALSRCLKLRRCQFGEFRRQLQLVRYRFGVIRQYPSRLHYFADWVSVPGLSDLDSDPRDASSSQTFKGRWGFKLLGSGRLTG